MSQVRIYFDDGTNQYTLPHVFHVSDPKEGMKATVIRGIRGDGSIIIPGGKKSQQIIVRGNLCSSGYPALTSLMNEMKQKVTTDVAVLKLQHDDGGWVDDWSYTVRRIEEIRFSQSLRTGFQEYEITFLVFAY